MVMKKTIVSLIVLTAIMIMATGCFNLQKVVNVSIEPLETKTRYIGETVVFTAKVTMTGSGGVGDVFAAEPTIKEYRWTIQLVGGAAEQVTTKDKTLTHTFSKPGSFQVSVEAMYDAQSAKSSALSLTIQKHTPLTTFSTYVNGVLVENRNNLRRNQQVELKVQIDDPGISEADLKDYMVKWKLSRTDLVGTQILGEGKYEDKHTIHWTIQERTPTNALYVLSLEVKDKFDNLYVIELDRFRVRLTQPSIPVLGTPSWEEHLTQRREGFRIPVRVDDDDTRWFELHRGGRLIDRVFVEADNPVGSYVYLWDFGAVRGPTMYTIRAVDGGDAATRLETEIDVTNRAPTKAIIFSPGIRVTAVADPTNFVIRWTGGDDPDFDDVTYWIYLGESKLQMLPNGQSDRIKQYTLNKKLVSGKTYWIRVDSSDGQHTRTGELHSFLFQPDIGAPFIKDWEYLFFDGVSKRWVCDLDFEYNDPFAGIIHKTLSYEVQCSKYPSFPSGNTYTQVVYVRTPQIQIPERFMGHGDPIFVRVRTVIETNQMKIHGNWSNVEREDIPPVI